MGWIHSCPSHPRPWLGFRPRSQQSCLFSSAAAQLGTPGPASRVGSSCVCPWLALRGARRQAGPGPYQLTFASEAARFQRPAAQAICHSVSPGEAGPPLGVPFCPQTELSLVPGSPSLSPQGGCRGPSTENDQSQELEQCPLAVPGAGLVPETSEGSCRGDREGTSDLESAGPAACWGEEEGRAKFSSGPGSRPELGVWGPRSQALAISVLQMRKGSERSSDLPSLYPRKRELQ